MGVKGLTHYVCQSTVASREIPLETFAHEYKKLHNRQPLLVFDGESFWHVLHGTLPRIFGGQFIQFRKKAEDFCKRLISMGFRLTFVFGNSPISAEAKAEERGKQTLIHLTSFYRQLCRKKNTPQINEIWPPCLRNVFPYYLRSVSGVTVLQSLMDKDLSIACYAKENKAAAIVSNDSDMLIFAVCPVMTARGLVTSRRRVVIMYPNHFCEDVGLPVERLPLLSVYLGNQETPITTNVVEASDGVIQRKIKSGDRGNVQDAIEYVTNLEAPISIEELARDIFQEVDSENINAVRVSLGRYILRERDYEFDVRPIYKKVKHSPMIEPIDSPCDNMTPEISLFLEKIKKPVIKCDIILKSKAWRREFNIMHMAWPVPGSGIDDPEGLYCPIFSAHAYLLGKKKHLMVVPCFENDPIKLAEPAFRNINLETKTLKLPDGSVMPNAHELWISQDKRLQIMALVSIWDATDLDFQTLMSMVPATLCFLLVLHWVRRKTDMEDWEVLAFLATHVRMRHFTCDQIWRMNDMNISKGLTSRSVVLANVFGKLMGRFLWMVSLCGAPFKTVDLLPDLMFDGMIFQKKYEQARNRSESNPACETDDLLDSICNQLVGQFDSRKDRDRVNKLFAILNGRKVSIFTNDDGSDRCRPIPQLSITNDYEPNWIVDWSSSSTSKTSVRRKSTSRNYPKPVRSKPQASRSSSGSRQSSTRGSFPSKSRMSQMRQAPMGPKSHDRYSSYERSSGFGSSSGFSSGLRHKSANQSDNFAGYQESNQYTDDQGYHTAATSQSRTLSQGSAIQPKPSKGACEDNNVLSFSDALASKCNENLNCQEDRDDTYSGARGVQFQDEEGWGEETNHRERKDRGSWEDVWEEAPQPPTRRQAAASANLKKATEQSVKLQNQKSKAKEWPSHDKDSDSWRDVENDKLNFFSNPGWPNSQADESDLGAGEWSSAGADHDESKSGPQPITEISYAQAAGAKQQQISEEKNFPSGNDSDLANKFQSSLTFRNVPEFVPAASRTTSRSPSESAPSEYEGYQSDTISISRPMLRNITRPGIAFGPSFGHYFPGYRRIGKKAHAENNQDNNANETDAQPIGIQHSSYSTLPMNGMMMPIMMMPVHPYNPLQQMSQQQNM